MVRGAGAVREQFGSLFQPYLFDYDVGRALELHVLEGLLCLFVFVSDELSDSDQQPEFGNAAVDPAFQWGVFEGLVRLGLDTSSAPVGDVRTRLAQFRIDFATDFVNDDRFHLKIDRFIPLERVYDDGGAPFLYGHLGGGLPGTSRWFVELNSSRS